MDDDKSVHEIRARNEAILAGTKVVPIAQEAYGKVIANAEIADNELRLQFEDGTKVRIWDDGQSCCEQRYMSTDDNVADIVGGTLEFVSKRPAPDIPAAEVHDAEFLAVETSKGSVVLVNHNEHNGYYGGFSVEASFS